MPVEPQIFAMLTAKAEHKVRHFLVIVGGLHSSSRKQSRKKIRKHCKSPRHWHLDRASHNTCKKKKTRLQISEPEGINQKSMNRKEIRNNKHTGYQTQHQNVYILFHKLSEVSVKFEKSFGKEKGGVGKQPAPRHFLFSGRKAAYQKTFVSYITYALTHNDQIFKRKIP